MAIIYTLCFAAPAFAWTHGQFNATTDACAGCHIAHAAPFPKLLKSGPTQTEFCYLCHADGGISAPYDIRDGKTVAGGEACTSTGGGFERLWDGPGTSDYRTVTSRHTVGGYLPDSRNQAGAWSGPGATQLVIPGGTDTLTGNGLVCGSCHDPHAGGKTPGSVSWTPPGSSGPYVVSNAVSGNPRLLRTAILGKTVDEMIFTAETVGTFTYLGVGSGVYRVTDYIFGSSDWCGACHDKFDTGTAGDRIAAEGHAPRFLEMWRHPVDVHAQPPSGAGLGDVSVDTGTPLELWTSGWAGLPDKVACLTCHRAHGATAVMDGWAGNWPRDSDMGGTGDTSALLRMDSRGICYNCHGAGLYNSWGDPRVDCGDCHPDVNGLKGHDGDGGAACEFCHI
jgi:predicted CXXCH cytochrome family protein